MKKKPGAAALAAALILLAGTLSGCGPGKQEEDTVQAVPETVPLTDTLPAFAIPVPTAPGVLVAQNGKAVIDYSNARDGYVMIRYSGDTTKKLKALIDTPRGETYTYSLEADESYAVLPLSDGDGSYTVGVYEQIEGMKYAVAVSASVDVILADEFAPFLRPSLYVNYDKNSAAVGKAAGLVRGIGSLTERIAAVYNYVTGNISYDKELAATVRSGYIPDLDAVLETGTGICFDYAALMTAMLRSQGIPTKLIFGYTGNAYHAWISVYSEETGWIDNVIYFDGVSWKRMDPTFAATGGQDSETMEYIGDGTNYIEKYQY